MTLDVRLVRFAVALALALGLASAAGLAAFAAWDLRALLDEQLEAAARLGSLPYGEPPELPWLRGALSAADLGEVYGEDAPWRGGDELRDLLKGPQDAGSLREEAGAELLASWIRTIRATRALAEQGFPMAALERWLSLRHNLAAAVAQDEAGSLPGIVSRSLQIFWSDRPPPGVERLETLAAVYDWQARLHAAARREHPQGWRLLGLFGYAPDRQLADLRDRVRRALELPADEGLEVLAKLPEAYRGRRDVLPLPGIAFAGWHAFLEAHTRTVAVEAAALRHLEGGGQRLGKAP